MVGVPTAIGLLTDTDVDDPSNTFLAVTSPQTSDHDYGSFAMTAGGLIAELASCRNALARFA